MGEPNHRCGQCAADDAGEHTPHSLEAASSRYCTFWHQDVLAASLTAKWQFVGKRSANEIVSDLNVILGFQRAKLAAHAPLTWNPAASCGIWCRGAAIAVRNVTVKRLPLPTTENDDAQRDHP